MSPVSGAAAAADGRPLGVESLLGHLDRPAVAEFLAAVDAAMNSNTLLLKGRADRPLSAGNARRELSSFLESAVFLEMMLEADRVRNWHNLQTGIDELVRPGFDLTLEPLDAVDRRLRWMLTEAFSPYNHHVEPAHADGLVAAFLGEILGPAPDEWSFWSVRPDFLRSSDYAGESSEPMPECAYFDGLTSDTATYFHRADVFYLLLTNGSP